MAHPGVKDPFRAKAKKRVIPPFVYKLKEIQQRYHLIQTGALVADLAAIRSWLQFCSQTVGPGEGSWDRPKAPTAPGAANVAFLKADIRPCPGADSGWARRWTSSSAIWRRTHGVSGWTMNGPWNWPEGLETAVGILKPGAVFW